MSRAIGNILKDSSVKNQVIQNTNTLKTLSCQTIKCQNLEFENSQGFSPIKYYILRGEETFITPTTISDVTIIGPTFFSGGRVFNNLGIQGDPESDTTWTIPESGLYEVYLSQDVVFSGNLTQELDLHPTINNSTRAVPRSSIRFGFSTGTNTMIINQVFIDHYEFEAGDTFNITYFPFNDPQINRRLIKITKLSN